MRRVVLALSGEGRAVTVRIQAQRQRVSMVEANDLERRTRPQAADGPVVRYFREQLGGSHAKGGEYHHWLRVREP
jgi:hypothetical protein